MNEASAKQKWCPMARVPMVFELSIHQQSGPQTHRISGVPGSVNRGYDGGTNQFPYARCVGSECMMWRVSAIDSADGFCGLAGFSNQGTG